MRAIVFFLILIVSLAESDVSCMQRASDEIVDDSDVTTSPQTPKTAFYTAKRAVSEKQGKFFDAAAGLATSANERIFRQKMGDVIMKFFVAIKLKSSHQDAKLHLKSLLKAMQNDEFGILRFQFLRQETLEWHCLVYHLLQALFDHQNTSIGSEIVHVVVKNVSVFTPLALFIFSLISLSDSTTLPENLLLSSLGAAFLFGVIFLSGRYLVPHLLPTTDVENPLIIEMIHDVIRAGQNQDADNIFDEETEAYINCLCSEQPQSAIIRELFPEYCDQANETDGRRRPLFQE